MEDHPVSTVVGGGMQEWANMHRRLIGRQASAGLIQSALGGSDTVCIATEGERERERGRNDGGGECAPFETHRTNKNLRDGW
jgi:hypothetical protein